MKDCHLESSQFLPDSEEHRLEVADRKGKTQKQNILKNYEIIIWLP